MALVVALDRSGNKIKPNKTKEFIGGNRRNETRYRRTSECRQKYIV